MSYRVQLMPRARRQLIRSVEWWEHHRPAAPHLLAEEMELLVENLIAFPMLGREVDQPTRRQILLPKTATIVIYRIRPRLQRIDIQKIVPARQ